MLSVSASVFDYFHKWWEQPQVSRRIALCLTLAFLGAVVAVILSHLSLLPPFLAGRIPPDPFFAIRFAFSLILAVEVVELIFALAESLSGAVAKQMEIMALILLRETFTDISLLKTDITLADDGPLMLQVAATAIAGLLLFVFRALFTKWYRTLNFNDSILTYVNAKKAVSLLLFLVFFSAGAYDVYRVALLEKETAFFQIFYTGLVFTDILLVLVSQYFMPCFQATFRNSGYAVGTLIMRVALASPHYLSALLCVFSGLYLLALTWATSNFILPRRPRVQREEAQTNEKQGKT